MPDYFALLGQPRRPWLEPDTLKQVFHTLSAEAHPDRFHGGSEAELHAANQRFAELNAAHSCLRDPRDRLRHLLELELGRKASDLQEIPDSLADLFMEVLAACREVEAFLTRWKAISSPLLRAQGVGEVHAWLDRLMALQQRIAALQGQLLTALKTVDDQWESPEARPDLLPELERICRWLGFFGRWHGLLQERVGRLMV